MTEVVVEAEGVVEAGDVVGTEVDIQITKMDMITIKKMVGTQTGGEVEAVVAGDIVILDMEESGVEVAEVMVMVVDVDGWATVQGVAITTRLSCWLDL